MNFGKRIFFIILIFQSFAMLFVLLTYFGQVENNTIAIGPTTTNTSLCVGCGQVENNTIAIGPTTTNTSLCVGCNLTAYFDSQFSSKLNQSNSNVGQTEHWLKMTSPVPDTNVDKKVCRLYSDFQQIDLLILMISRKEESAFRNAVRTTWCSYSNRNTANVRCAFLVGNNVHGNISKDAKLANESKEFEDIVFGNFVDSYKNCTFKVIMGYRWAQQFCSVAKFVVKADIDVWLDLPHLMNLLKKQKLESSLAGRCFKANPIRVTKGYNAKWYVSKKDWPLSTYGTICVGAAYVLTIESMIKIIDVTHRLPFLWIEDVYISLCAQALKFKIIQLPGYERSNYKNEDKCDFKSGKRALAHVRNVDQLKKIWKTKC